MAIEGEELSDRTQKGTKDSTTLGLLLTIVNHPSRENQDTTCPDIQWMGEDLVHCPGIGEWKCMLQKERYGDLLCGGGSENLDYLACDHPDHKQCSVYLEHQKPAIPSQRSQLELQFS